MKTPANFLSWKGAATSPIYYTLRKACNEFDIDLKVLPMINGSGEDHFNLIKKTPNTIAWVCFARPEEEIKANSNILFLENGILERGQYYYLDDNGYGSKSNIVLKGYNRKNYSDSYVKETYDHLKDLKWPVMSGFNKDGPIMIALQARQNEDEELILKCKKYLPKNLKVIIRGHPKTVRENKEEEVYSKHFGDNYELDSIEDIFESLSRCRAVVVNSSSVMFKALVMGIPVAACKRGFNSGSTSVFDCSREPSLLQYLLDFRFEEKSSQNMICSLREHSISRHISSVDEALKNSNFANWLKRTIIP